jgi:hypothetical protein
LIADGAVNPKFNTAEHRRLADSAARRADWKSWGPYLAERAWGTVREDYSASGDAWNHFPHDHARSRAYRWNEDGLAGFCNRFQNMCLAVALWNGKDPILKERLFGLANQEGNHGEDVKEYYYYLDAVPTHAYMRMLYKYPSVEYPYADIVHENGRRSRKAPEYELIDALGDALAAGRYFDVFVEYGKVREEEILCRISAVNCGPEPAELHVLPHLWYRNTWSWGHDPRRPEVTADGPNRVRAEHRHLGARWWFVEATRAFQEVLFTENETNAKRLFGIANASTHMKDAFHEYVVHGQRDRVNPARVGTKAAAHYWAVLEPREQITIRTRLSRHALDVPFADFDQTMTLRRNEADEFHAAIEPPGLSADERLVRRQAHAGLLWSKQFYHYSVELWLDGDTAGPPPPPERHKGRNSGWRHVYNLDVLSVPDKWEYPWFAAWDTAFHCIPLARLDPEWAKRQLVLLLREWYMHPNGQLAAYEWDFSDVNPPVHAHAARRVYEICREVQGCADTDFLEEVFHKLLLNFTWWVNRKDPDGRNAFQGGFLGLDNIGVFDRSRPNLGDGRTLEQADGTAWMGLFCLDMLAIALELARTRPAYEATATKFFEHFVSIAYAINGTQSQLGMWHEDDGFYHDVLRDEHGTAEHLRIRSLVGLVPLLAVLAIDRETLECLPQFRRRMEWFLRYRPNLVANMCLLRTPGAEGHILLSVADRTKLERILPRMLDPTQFLSRYGIRSMSRALAADPFVCDGAVIAYEPGESTTAMYGGNSNWRGPIWFPINYLMVEALREYHRYFGSSLLVEMPRWSFEMATLGAVADELARRLVSVFLRDESRDGRRPVLGDCEPFQKHAEWRDYVPFYEYFHGEDGAGLGASHQTGWTALVAELMHRRRS